jgi:alpha-beta hydrolase superfamily lysophospholipase
MRSRWKRVVLGLLALACLMLNALAYRHAWSMTHFVESGERPPPPEKMSLGQKASAIFTGIEIPKPRNRKTPADYDLPFETHRFATSDGLACEAWHVPCDATDESGAARGLCVMFHGFSTSKASLLPPAKVLHELGYDALLVDFRGSGGSDGRATTIGYREADDVAAACAFAGQQWPELPQVLYGRSMGAAAVLRALAIGQLQPAAVILECPFDRLLATTKNRFRAAGLPSFPAAELLVFWGGLQHGYSGFDHNPVDYAAAVACPALFLHGEHDIRVSPAEAREVFDRLAGEKTWKLVEGAGHENLSVARPEEWRPAVERFLYTLSGGNVGFRSAKASPFAERKATLE